MSSRRLLGIHQHINEISYAKRFLGGKPFARGKPSIDDLLMTFWGKESRDGSRILFRVV